MAAAYILKPPVLQHPTSQQAYKPMAMVTNGQHHRYTKHELLGQGACKKVFKGFDEDEGIEIAWNEVPVAELASSSEKERDRIFGEITLLKQLKHKNVLALHDWWYDKQNAVLVFITELFMDGSLRSYRRKHKNVDTTVLKRWAWQILQGLVYLHGHNPPIIHRDLKSDNIFVNGTSGILKIGDLGFATFRAGFSAAMSVIGTPEFMAPELYEERYNEKVDVYSFGMCLMELATLEYPYSECRNPAQIFKKVSSGVPPQGLAKIQDQELREFVQLCIQQDASLRPEARQLLKHPFFDCIREGRRPLERNLLTPISGSGSLGPSASGDVHKVAAGHLDSAQDSPNLMHSPSGVASPGTSAAPSRITIVAGTGETLAAVQAARLEELRSQAGTPTLPEPSSTTQGRGQPAQLAGLALHMAAPTSPTPGYMVPGALSGLGASSIAAAVGSRTPSSTQMAVTPFSELAQRPCTPPSTGTDNLQEDILLEGSPDRISTQGRSSGLPIVPFAGQSSKNFEEEEEGDEGGEGEDLRQRVRLACRNHQDNMLAFSMSFVNHSGTRKKVGFQYDMEYDTARAIADEMIQNLSLDAREADFIADLIQGEILKFQDTDAAGATVVPTSALTSALKAISLDGSGSGIAAPPQLQLTIADQGHPAGAPVQGEQQAVEEGHEGEGEGEGGEGSEEEEDPSCFF